LTDSSLNCSKAFTRSTVNRAALPPSTTR
jgi:hypothetical protein